MYPMSIKYCGFRILRCQNFLMARFKALSSLSVIASTLALAVRFNWRVCRIRAPIKAECEFCWIVSQVRGTGHALVPTKKTPIEQRGSEIREFKFHRRECSTLIPHSRRIFISLPSVCPDQAFLFDHSLGKVFKSLCRKWICAILFGALSSTMITTIACLPPLDLAYHFLRSLTQVSSSWTHP
jgi:hypothetical protein